MKVSATFAVRIPGGRRTHAGRWYDETYSHGGGHWALECGLRRTSAPPEPLEDGAGTVDCRRCLVGMARAVAAIRNRATHTRRQADTLDAEADAMEALAIEEWREGPDR